MSRSKRVVVKNIIAVMPYIYSWADEIEKEQERVISDLVSPAESVIKRLILLDNMRIDLCNLKVLYGTIERELGTSFGVFCDLIDNGECESLLNRAICGIKSVGYDEERVLKEFGYLFKKLPKNRRSKKGLSSCSSKRCFEGVSAPLVSVKAV